MKPVLPFPEHRIKLMKKYYTVISVLIAGLFLTGMSSPIDDDEAALNEPATDSHQAKHKHSTDYAKPHAGIDLTFHQSKAVEAGESFELQLTLRTRSAADQLQVRLRSDEGLQLDSADAYQFDTRQGMTHSVVCEFSALQDGQYYVNVTASLQIDGKQQSRSFTIPVTVGDPATFKSSAEEANSKRGYRLDAEQGVISMPAVETTE